MASSRANRATYSTPLFRPSRLGHLWPVRFRPSPHPSPFAIHSINPAQEHQLLSPPLPLSLRFRTRRFLRLSPRPNSLAARQKTKEPPPPTHSSSSSRFVRLFCNIHPSVSPKALSLRLILSPPSFYSSAPIRPLLCRPKDQISSSSSLKRCTSASNSELAALFGRMQFPLAASSFLLRQRFG